MRLAELHGHSGTIPLPAAHAMGRGGFTRIVDAAGEFARKHVKPLHWFGIRLVAMLLYIYVRLLGMTARLITSGTYQWPDLARGAVLVFWHGSAPSLVAAFAARKPKHPMTLMISCDARGDCVAVLAQWLGFRIVRGDAEHGGWRALVRIANQVHEGACALISPDGRGPAFVANVGAVALAAAANAPLIPIGADCRPSVFEPHKWDSPRNPLPFGRIAVVCGEPISFPRFEDAASLEKARTNLEDALNRVTCEAKNALHA